MRRVLPKLIHSDPCAIIFKTGRCDEGYEHAVIQNEDTGRIYESRNYEHTMKGQEKYLGKKENDTWKNRRISEKWRKVKELWKETVEKARHIM